MKEVRLTAQQGLTWDGIPICNFSLNVDGLYHWADSPEHGRPAFLRLIISSDTARYHRAPGSPNEGREA